jgi:hypothetical protein
MSREPFTMSECSERLREIRAKFSTFRHGGVVLQSEQVEQLVQEIDRTIALAKNLEFAVTSPTWTLQAAADRRELLNNSSVVVLSAFRDDPKIVPFPGRGPQPGGAA